MIKKCWNGLLLAALAFAASLQASGQEASARGTRGTAVRGAVVNFTDVARQEKLSPRGADLVEPVAIHPPKRTPDELPIPDGVEVVHEAPALKPPAAPSLLVPSPGYTQSFLGSADNTRSVPPDTHGAVGPNHMMITLNGSNITNGGAGVRVQDRGGNVVSNVALTTFFGGQGQPNSKGLTIAASVFDPRVFYDPYAARWIIVAVADSRALTSSIVVAVSQTGDPTGNWNLYQVDADANTNPSTALWADYPSVGFNTKWIVVNVNMFPVSTGGGFSSHTYAFDKAKLYANGPGDHAKFADTTASKVAAVTFEANSGSIYLVSVFGSSAIRLYSITGAPGGETFNSLQVVTASQGWNFGAGELGPQLESARTVATNDTRIQNVVFRNGSLWLAHTVFLPATGTATRSAVQWWQVNPATGATVQRGRIDDPAGVNHYAFPSIMVNRDNDVLVGYSQFSKNQFVSANYSYRDHADAPGTMRDPVIYKRGEGAYFKTFSGTSNRWGDYSATAIDPQNDTDMWTLQEYAAAPVGTGNGSGRWGVWWARVTPGSAAAEDPVQVRLDAAAQTADEALGKVEIQVTRILDTSAAALVDYATSPGSASDRADFIPSIGTLRFAPGETTKNITVFITNDTFQEPVKTFTLALSNPRNCSLAAPDSLTVTINSDDASDGPNPMREAAFSPDYFVRQHYVDFLNREPDAPGLNFWRDQLTSCGANAACLDLRKQNVSAAFFLSIEFQETGYLVYKTYGAAFGTRRIGSTVPLTPREFLPDTQRIGRGVVVNQGDWQAQLEANKAAYFDEFAARPAFLAQYPASMAPAQFVDLLNANSGGSLSPAERDVLVGELTAGARTRAQALRVVAEDADFTAREKNRAFVLMQYFGYLRRNPPDAPELNLDFSGYNFWLGKLNNHGGNFVSAEMVRSFLVSGEYLGRFGP